MNIRTLLLVILSQLLASIKGLCQTDASLPGLVVLQNSKFQTGHLVFISDASVRSTVKCIPTTSDANGKFTLVFADKPIGDAATIIVTRDGFEVVNERELESASVVGRLSPLKVVMCKQGTVYANKMKYYQISDSVIQMIYEKRYAALLKKEGQQYQEVISSLSLEMKRQIRDLNDAMALLKEQLEIQKKQVRDIVDHFVIENLDDESENYQLAFKAFTRGEIDSALFILDKVDLAKRLDANTKMIPREDSMIQHLKESIVEKKKQVQQDIGEALLDARMHKLKYQFEKAKTSYDLVLKYDSTNVNVYWEYSNFLKDVNDLKRKSQVYQNALRIFKGLANKNIEMRNTYGFFLFRDGMQNVDIDNFDLAESEYLEAIYIFSHTSAGTPLNNLNVARVKGLLGELYQIKKDNKKAEQYLKSSLDYYKELAKKFPFIYQKDVGLGDFFMAHFYWGKSNQLAISYLKEAFDIYKSYTEKSADYDPQRLGIVTLDMADLYLMMNDLNHAEEYYHKADLLYNKILKDNPVRYKQDLANVQIGLGKVYSKRRDYEKAESYLAKSLNIYEEMSLTNAHAFDRKIAEIKKLTGNIYRFDKQYDKAEKNYNQALLLNKELENRLKNDESDKAKIYTSLGYLYQDKKDYTNAEKSLLVAVSTYEYLSSTDALYRSDVAFAYNELGNLYLEMADYGKCEKSFLKAFSIYVDLNKMDSLYYQQDIAKMHSNIGVLYYNEKKYKEAESELQKSFIIRSGLLRKDSSFDIAVAETENNLGILYNSMREFKNSENSLFQAAIIYRKHLPESFEYYGEKLGNLQGQMGYMYSNFKNYSKAEDAFSAAIETNRQLVGINPKLYNQQFYIARNNLINLYQSMVDSFKTEQLRLKYRQQTDSLYNTLNVKYYSKGGRSQIAANTCGSLSWHLLVIKKYKEAETAAGWGLSIDSSQIWIKTNHAHALLFQERYKDAEKEYLDLKQKKNSGDGRLYKFILLEDLAYLEKTGATCKDMQKIKEILKQ